MRAGTIASQLTQKERTLRDLDDQITSLNEEMSRLSRQGDTRTKLSIKRSDYEDKTAAARTLQVSRTGYPAFLFANNIPYVFSVFRNAKTSFSGG